MDKATVTLPTTLLSSRSIFLNPLTVAILVDVLLAVCVEGLFEQVSITLLELTVSFV